MTALLLAPVSYTPLFEDEVYEHFAAVADSGDLLFCIYNNPSTTKFTFTNALISRLAEIPNVSAIKMLLPAGGDFEAELADFRSMMPSSFSIGYSGDWEVRRHCSPALTGVPASLVTIQGVRQFPGDVRHRGDSGLRRV